MHQLHDWTLVGVNFEWRSACAVLEFDGPGTQKCLLIAEGVRLLEIPKKNDWGPSDSVNEVCDVDATSGGGRCLQIEMQSGDVIQILAATVLRRETQNAGVGVKS